MTTIEILKKARDLLSDPERWTQNVGARTAQGIPVSADSKEAVCFCASMAVVKVSNEVTPIHFPKVLDFDRWSDLFMWNDAPERTHAEILQRFDEAIARLEAAG